MHNPLSQDGHTHVCWLRSQAADSLDQSAMVQPKVEISVGDDSRLRSWAQVVRSTRFVFFESQRSSSEIA